MPRPSQADLFELVWGEFVKTRLTCLHDLIFFKFESKLFVQNRGDCQFSELSNSNRVGCYQVSKYRSIWSRLMFQIQGPPPKGAKFSKSQGPSKP